MATPPAPSSLWPGDATSGASTTINPLLVSMEISQQDGQAGSTGATGLDGMSGATGASGTAGATGAVGKAKMTALVPLEVEADASPGPRRSASPRLSPRLRRSVVDVGRTTQPGWCVGNTAYGIFLLCVALAIESVLFAFHCTPVLDLMVDEPDAAAWCGVTTPVAIGAGVILVPAMLEALVVLGQLTCCWRRAVRRERRKAHYTPWRRVSEAKTTFRAVWRGFSYLRKPTSAHYVRLIFLFEVKEFAFQALALEQMSRAGIGPIALSLYATILLINGAVPMATRRVIGRINLIDDPVRRRAEASKFIARLLLFDATCDLLYSSFSLGHLIFRYFRIFGEADAAAAELRMVKAYVINVGSKEADVKAFLLLSEAENALYGSKSSYDTIVKFMSRVAPLMQAPFRVMTAFSIRQSLSAGNDRTGGADATETAAAAAIAVLREEENEDDTCSSSDGSDNEEREEEEEDSNRTSRTNKTSRSSRTGTADSVAATAAAIAALREKDRGGSSSTARSGTTTAAAAPTMSMAYRAAAASVSISTRMDESRRRSRESSSRHRARTSTVGAHRAPAAGGRSIRRAAVLAVRRSAYRGRYNNIPLWAAGPLLVTVFALCFFVYIRLSTWGKCQISELSQSCAVRAFPVFRTFGNDWACRSCACNTWVYAERNCSGIYRARARANGGSNLTTSVEQRCGAAASGEELPAGSRYASETMSLSAAILQPTITVFIYACPHDTNLLSTLAMYGRDIAVLRIDVAPQKATNTTTTTDKAGDSKHASAAAVNWTFPPGFGYRRGPQEELGNEPWPIVVFEIIGNQRRNSQPVRLSNLPQTLWEMSNCRSLRIEYMAVDYIPDDVAALGKLLHLRWSGNQITSLPSAMGRVASLANFECNGCALSELPPSVFRHLVRLTAISLASNRLSEIPPVLETLTSMRILHAAENTIKSIPAFVEKLAMLEGLGLSNNQLSTLPSFVGDKLTRLRGLDLVNNALATVPSTLGKLSRLNRLSLDNCSLTSIPASILKVPLIGPSPSSHFLLSLESNNIGSLAPLRSAMAAPAPSMLSAGDFADAQNSEPTYSLFVGGNPACRRNDGTSSSPSVTTSTSTRTSASSDAIPSRVGPWQILCEPECAPGCRETATKGNPSRLSDGQCSLECDTRECAWDGGECEVV